MIDQLLNVASSDEKEYELILKEIEETEQKLKTLYARKQEIEKKSDKNKRGK